MNIQLIFNMIIGIFLLWLSIKWSSKTTLDSIIKTFIILMFIIDLILTLSILKIL